MSFKKSVDTYLKSVETSGEQEPLVTALRATAEELDKKMHPAMLNQFRMLYKQLSAGSAAVVDEEDEYLDGI